MAMKENTFTCSICQAVESVNNFDNHLNSHIGAFPFYCKTCPAGFLSRLQYDDHVKDCHKAQTSKSKPNILLRRHQCSICTSSYCNDQNFLIHSIDHLIYTDIKCDSCKFLFFELKDCAIHQHLHQNNLCCNLCGYNSLEKQELLLHVQAHSPDRYFRKFNSYLTCTKEQLKHKDTGSTSLENLPKTNGLSMINSCNSTCFEKNTTKKFSVIATSLVKNDSSKNDTKLLPDSKSISDVATNNDNLVNTSEFYSKQNCDDSILVNSKQCKKFDLYRSYCALVDRFNDKKPVISESGLVIEDFSSGNREKACNKTFQEDISSNILSDLQGQTYNLLSQNETSDVKLKIIKFGLPNENRSSDICDERIVFKFKDLINKFVPKAISSNILSDIQDETDNLFSQNKTSDVVKLGKSNFGSTIENCPSDICKEQVASKDRASIKITIDKDDIHKSIVHKDISPSFLADFQCKTDNLSIQNETSDAEKLEKCSSSLPSYVISTNLNFRISENVDSEVQNINKNVCSLQTTNNDILLPKKSSNAIFESVPEKENVSLKNIEKLYKSETICSFNKRVKLKQCSVIIPKLPFFITDSKSHRLFLTYLKMLSYQPHKIPRNYYRKHLRHLEKKFQDNEYALSLIRALLRQTVEDSLVDQNVKSLMKDKEIKTFLYQLSKMCYDIEKVKYLVPNSPAKDSKKQKESILHKLKPNNGLINHKKRIQRLKNSLKLIKQTKDLKEVKIEIFRLPDIVYDKHLKEKPIMLSNVMPDICIK